MERREAVMGGMVLASCRRHVLSGRCFLPVWCLGVCLFLLLNPLIDGLLDKAGEKPQTAQKGRRMFRRLAVGVWGGVTALLSMAYGGKEFAGAEVFLFLFFAILAVTAAVDQETMEIPDCLPAAIGVLSAVMLGVKPDVLERISLAQRLAGFFSVSFPMLLLSLAIPGAFGGGDIKLMAACGVFLGWKLNLLALFFAVLTGGFWGIWLLAEKKATGKDFFAFGPFLCIGLQISVFWGEKILQWYCSLLW